MFLPGALVSTRVCPDSVPGACARGWLGQPTAPLFLSSFRQRWNPGGGSLLWEGQGLWGWGTESHTWLLLFTRAGLRGEQMIL